MADTIAITGANGFIGRHLCAWFAERGWSVRAMVRSPEAFAPPRTEVEAYRCELPDRIDAAALEGTVAVVHCAYETRAKRPEQARATNEEGTQRLLQLSRDAGVGHFVFLSSISAHPGALSYYGRSKFAIEESLDLARDSVIRSGLVIGPGEGGLFHRMVDSLRRTPLVPVIDGGHQILQTVYLDDLSGAIERVVDMGDTGRRVIGEVDGLTVRDFFSALGERLGVRPRFVPIPGRALAAALRAVEKTPISLPITSENVLGMRSLRHQESRADLEALGISARDTAESLDLTLRRR